MSDQIYIAIHSIEYVKDGKRESAIPGNPVVFDDAELGESLLDQGAIREATEGEVALFEKQMAGTKTSKGKGGAKKTRSKAKPDETSTDDDIT